MTIQIDIDPETLQASLSLTPDITWNLALRSLAATIQQLAFKTVDAVVGDAPKNTPKKELKKLRKEVSGDVADEINFAISNVLTTLSPDTAESKLTETAIATLENEIIHYAADNHLTLEQAIQVYQNNLKDHPHAAKPSGINDTLNPSPTTP